MVTTIITANASTLRRVSDCDACNGYGLQYVRGSGRYDESGIFIHDWTPCPDCERDL